MDLDRISALLQPFLINPHQSKEGLAEPSKLLTTAQFADISTYIDILVHWNARMNLTAIREPEGIVTRHFGESLFAARHLFPNEDSQKKHYREGHDFNRADPDSHKNPALPLGIDAVHAADLGSGSGFPGIPIRLWATHISMTLIESNQKKATFLREVVRAITLTNINIQNTRAETITKTFDVVTLRAVERFTGILPVASRLLAPAGRLALLISASQLETARSNLIEIKWGTPIPIPRSESRILLVGSRESAE